MENPGLVGDVVSLFIASRQARGVSPGYVVTMEAMLNVVRRDLAAPARTLTPEKVEEFMARLDCAPVTKNNYLQLLRMSFRWARRRRLLPAECDAPEVVERVVEPPRESALYSAEELRRWFAELPVATWAVIALVALCGVRMAEARRMSRADLDGGRALVSAGKAKTRARRFVPVCDSARAWIVTAPGEFWTGTRMELAEAVRNARRRAGVAAKRNGLRHSFISYRLALVQDENRVALEAGTSPACIFRHYRETATAEAAREWFNVGPREPLRMAA